MTLRVVGAGLPRTGTSSLRRALEQLLGGKCCHMSALEGHPFNLGEGWDRALAGQATDWEKVKALYDGMRTRVRYKFDPKLESAVTALKKGEGDCGELTSLFVALCRAQKIPARTVWVMPSQSVQETGHCYPEFYLEDETGRGRWFPCQAAGDSQFGEIYEVRPILQKGDNFQVPGERKPQHFAAQTFQARDAKANPRVRWVQKQIELDR